eukprot:1013297_1
MAQSSLYKLGANKEIPMNELLCHIALDITNLQEILNAVGTTSDTIDKRHEFNTLRNQVNEKISQATRIISRSLTSDDKHSDSEEMDTTKYQNELMEYTNSLRNIVSKAIKSFRSYSPHSNIINLHNEKSPLLSSQKQTQLLSSSYAKDIKIINETQLIEYEEEKI